MHLQSRPVA